MDALTALDTRILLWLHGTLESPFMNTFMIFITRLSNGGLIWILLCLGLLCFKKTRKIGLYLAVALIIDSVLVNLILKPIFMRVRPYQALGLSILIKAPSGTSFPSGHSSIAFTGATTFLLLAKDRHMKEAGWALEVLAFLTAVSRMYLLVHYPSDVLVGALIGIGCAYLTRYLKNRNCLEDLEQKWKDRREKKSNT